MARTRRRQTPPPTNPNNPNNMIPEAVQTMIDQALLRNSSGGDGSHSSHAENLRNMHTARPCYYADFMKCHPLNFKGTEGAVGLTRWIEKMESVFNISECAVENQVKFATLVMSADSAVTYSSVHSEARSWSIPSEDPYEEAAQQLFEQAPHSPEALGAEMNAIASYLYHSLHPSGIPSLLPIPLSKPSTSRRAEIPEANTPPQNRPLLATPRPGCEVGESFAAVARRPGPTMAHGVDCSYVKTRLRDTDRRMMAALELVNLRFSYQVDDCTRESSEFCTRHHDAQKDCAAVRAEIKVLRSERLAYKQEGI
nr:hypothetical protein [Tanacetum cinerariifolium]